MKRIRFIAMYFVALAVVMALWGCIEKKRERTESQQQHREYNESGTQAGQPYTKTGTETVVTETVEKEVTKTGLDPEAIKQLTSAVSSAVIAQLIPLMPKPLTGSAQLDGTLQTIIAYLLAKGGLAGAGKLRRKQGAA